MRTILGIIFIAALGTTAGVGAGTISFLQGRIESEFYVKAVGWWIVLLATYGAINLKNNDKKRVLSDFIFIFCCLMLVIFLTSISLLTSQTNLPKIVTWAIPIASFILLIILSRLFNKKLSKKKSNNRVVR